MKITDIKTQVKRSDRYSIFVDGKYSFSISEKELLNLGLRIGQDYGQAEFSELKDKAILDKAYDRALGLIMRRPRSRWEIETYLRRKDYSIKQIAKVSQILEENNYLDDLNFAKRWIENRRLLKSISKRKLKLELRQKRVSDEIISQALVADKADDKDALRELVTKKRTQSRYQDDQKLIAYLARQGFGYDDIKLVLEETS